MASNNKKKKPAPSGGKKPAQSKKAAPPAKKKLWPVVVLGVAVVALVALAFVLGGRKTDDSETLLYTRSDGPFADIDIEGYGVITVALDEQAAPVTVANFIDLAESGFYDGLTFHRIMEGFMMQGGDPEGNGTGGSEKTIVGEFAANGYDNPLSHTRGAISMARSNDYDSASSQFFIVHEDSTFLDGSYAAFGYVTSGMDIVDAICASARPTDDNGSIPPEEQPVITSITIRR